MIGHRGPETEAMRYDHSKSFFSRFLSSRHLAGCRCVAFLFSSPPFWPSQATDRPCLSFLSRSLTILTSFSFLNQCGSTSTWKRCYVQKFFFFLHLTTELGLPCPWEVRPSQVHPALVTPGDFLDTIFHLAIPKSCPDGAWQTL